MKRYLVEFIGTFFLVFTIGMSVRSGSPLAPIAIGAGLMGMIYAGGHVSGAHFNPAVTLAAFIRGRLPSSDIPGYVVAQLAAALAAGFLVTFLHGAGPVGTLPIHGVNQSVIAEFLFTFALVWVILNVATAKGTAGNSHYGLAIGLTVTAGAVSVGHISGGAFNPAVGLALYVMGLESAQQLAIYVVSDLAGGAAAAGAYLAVNGRE